MNDIEAFGQLIGKALAERKADQPSFNVHVPRVEVSVDAAPLAAAVRAGHDLNAKALEGVGGVLTDAVCKAFVEAAGLVPTADLSVIEKKIGDVASAQASAAESLIMAMAKLATSIDASTEMTATLVGELRQQNEILMRDKTVSYDGAGRISRIGIA